MTQDAYDGVFDDVVQANRQYAEAFQLTGFPGVARAGLAILTCMDVRIDPLALTGLQPGDAVILRNPGGQVGEQELSALVLATNLLHVERVMVVEHTRCAMASSTRDEFHERIAEVAGRSAEWLTVGAITDQRQRLRDDVARVRTHPLVPAAVSVGGFLYDVDTGLLEPVC